MQHWGIFTKKRKKSVSSNLFHHADNSSLQNCSLNT